VILNDIPYLEDLSEEEFEKLKTKKIIASDPGRKFLLYMMDEEGNELRYSCMQRDTETLGKRTCRIMRNNKKMNEIDQIETHLATCTKCTVQYDKFKEYIRVKHKVILETKSFYEDKLYRKLTWRRKTYRQRSEDRFLNRIRTKFGLSRVWLRR
jgi:uncharacterized protein YjhX (UPF0386 family)